MDTGMFFPRAAPSAMTPYLIDPFHEWPLAVALSRSLATFYGDPAETSAPSWIRLTKDPSP